MTFPLAHPLTDLQDACPAAAISLSRVGIVNARMGIILEDESPLGQPCTICIDISVGLSASQRGVHMSRFHEALGALTQTTDGALPPISLARLAHDLARDVAERQGADSADVSIVAQATVIDLAPDSSSESRMPVDVAARAILAPNGIARTLLTVSVTGMNACPCAQHLVRARASERLASEGFSGEDIARILALVPGATHNQRGTATLSVGSASVDALPNFVQLTDVARNAMSGHIHELLKRGDELEVVLAAHARPHFVEDCVREGLTTLSARVDLPADAYGFMHQVNHESIHAHDVTAERGALLRDLRAELAAGSDADATNPKTARHLAPEAWIGGHF